jgi:hypothetical protein
VLAATRRFVIFDEVEIPNPQHLSREGLADRLHSSSQFSRLTADRQQELIEEIGTMIEGDEAELALVTRVTALRRVN